MKLSRKIGKIFSREAHARGLRRLRRKLRPLPVHRFLEHVDNVRLNEIQSRYARSASDSEKYKKYLAGFDRWMKVNAQRAQDLKLNRCEPLDILDLGCGGGFFLFVCKQLGHRCLGLDTSEHRIFDELIELFRVERYIWKILPFEPLPDLGRKFDLITAFATGFNADLQGHGIWGVNEWDFLLNDLAQHLRPGGRVLFGINTGPDGRRYPKGVRDLFTRRGAVLERNRAYFANGCVALSC
jgi:SAM-dependent methyltransferase